MKRRDFVAATAAALVSSLAAPSVRAQQSQVLKYARPIEIANLDPHWSPTGGTRLYALAVFDTLYGMGRDYKVYPQMVEGVVVEEDGRRWTLKLRPGLKFHDGEPVLARDCAASIRRWGQRNSFGQALLAATDDVTAANDRTIVFRLKKPFPLLPEALGTNSGPLPVMMPERFAKAPSDGTSQLKEIIGSGPYRWKADERVLGHRAVYERFDDYQPRQGGASDWLAGPKIAYFERIEWTVLPDPSTASAALRTAEVDWWEEVHYDLVALLRSDSAVRVESGGPTGILPVFRMNHLQPPFNNPRIRRALLFGISQEDCLVATAGTDPALWRAGVGCFPPVSPMATTAGLDVLMGPRDLDRVRHEITAAGYRGERVVMLVSVDDFNSKPSSDVSADLMRKVGLNVDYQSMEFASFFQRIFKTDPVDQGGWSCYCTEWLGTDCFSPAVHPYIRGNGTAGRPGWPTSARLEELRNAWLEAADLVSQQRIAEALQEQVFIDVPVIPLGQVFPHTAYRASLEGVVPEFPFVFWNVRRRG